MKNKELFLRGFSINRAPDNCDRYPLNINSLKHVNTFRFRKQVTIFIGENGAGKSTILEALAVAYGFNPEGGSKNFSFTTKQSHSDLYEAITLSRLFMPKDGFFLRSESFYNVATEIEALDEEYPSDFLDNYGGKSLHVQSHGESFLALFLNRFGKDGLYMLDEPEAALSVASQLTFIYRLDELARMNSQFILATHSPLIMAYPDADLYLVSDEGIRPIAFEETDQFYLMKAFMNDPKGYLKKFLTS